MWKLIINQSNSYPFRMCVIFLNTRNVNGNACVVDCMHFIAMEKNCLFSTDINYGNVVYSSDCESILEHKTLFSKTQVFPFSHASVRSIIT